MSPVTLSAWEQIGWFAVWALTLIAAYLRGGLIQQDRHIESLQRHLEFLRGVEDEAGDA